MSAEQKATDQNALATRLSGFWGNFKQGKIISYKWMAILLILVAGIGVTWYILSASRSEKSKRWMEEEEAASKEAQEEVSKKYPGTIQDKLARMQIARNLLGESGIEMLNSSNPRQRTDAVENIEKAREMFQKLLDDFKGDPVFKAQSLLGLAKAEAALVAVPASPNQLIEFKGKVPKVVEYLDQLSEAAAPDTSWATDSKKLADAIRDDKSAGHAEFIRVQRSLFSMQGPELPKLDGFPPFGGPGGPGGFGGPLGPIPPVGPGGPGGTGPTAPGIPGGK